MSIGGISVPLISNSDAAFLYREHRIEKFATFKKDGGKVKAMAPALGIKDGDLLIFEKSN